MALKRRLNDSLILYKNRRFPASFKRESRLRYTAVIGIGGNIGDVRRRFEHLLHVLARARKVALRRSSAILKNPPFGYREQDDFYNAVLELQTSMTPYRFLDFLLHTEKRFGRKRSFANAPRTLDLDIIFFDGRMIDTPRLQVPHPHWFKRESVIIPLSTLYM